MCIRKWTLLEVASGGSGEVPLPAAGIAYRTAMTAVRASSGARLLMGRGLRTRERGLATPVPPLPNRTVHADEPEGRPAVRGHVRDLGDPVPDDPRRGARARAGHARLSPYRDRRSAAPAVRAVAEGASRAAPALARPLALHRDRGCASLVPAREGRDEA